ncbi:hypothetical protein [Paenibacillus donghaensis]|uniref:Uncharacterized protein n=1 Tax=Paenibacillus donghaensis TaxID=414771 RepID=A0A2Z2KAQ0_9BACL|nr:hypothetical protein [Paenibacillus donghaensis]ASA22567.1 hypothetical protein B9T62_18330 [Paenibacillus donghaensis]
MEYWNTIKIVDIASVRGVGGRFSDQGDHTYFTVAMKDGQLHTFHYANRDAYAFRRELKGLYNEVNKIGEYYLLENNTYIEVNGESILYGCRVENNLNDYEYKTLLEIETLRREGKIVDEGWRHLCYISLIKIQHGKVVRGVIDDAAIAQIKSLGLDLKIEKGKYINGELKV